MAAPWPHPHSPLDLVFVVPGMMLQEQLVGTFGLTTRGGTVQPPCVAVTFYWFALPESCQHDPSSRQPSSSTGFRRQRNQARHCFREGESAELGGSWLTALANSPVPFTQSGTKQVSVRPAHGEARTAARLWGCEMRCWGAVCHLTVGLMRVCDRDGTKVPRVTIHSHSVL